VTAFSFALSAPRILQGFSAKICTVFLREIDKVTFPDIGMEGEAIFDDLMLAAQSSLHFWDNPLDDEEWNNAWEGRI